jgi:hypothetical protein
MLYKLSATEKTRLKRAVRAALSVPFIAGMEGYVWEAIFHYVKGLPLPDPHTNKRMKALFDAVDADTHVGWSLKAVQKSPESSSLDLVIQRADIFKKRKLLGFPKLSLKSPTEELGRALLTHWNAKIDVDQKLQGVDLPRIAILIKSKDHRRYALLEQDFYKFAPDELTWSWTNQTHTGLQARRKDNSVALRWYPNQKQLFESFVLSTECYRFEINPDSLSPDDFLNVALGSQATPSLSRQKPS